MRREQRIDRVVGDEPGALEPARVEHIADDTAAEDRRERRLDNPTLHLLQAVVLDPDFRLLDEEADVDDGQGGRDADPQHAAPTEAVEQQPVTRARQQEAKTPRTLQYTAHEPARTDRPLLH